MTEERIKELAKFTIDNIVGWSLPEQGRRIMGLIRTVAAEAREEGIDEMQDATCFCEKCLIPGHRPLCAVCEAAERLKEKGK